MWSGELSSFLVAKIAWYLHTGYWIQSFITKSNPHVTCLGEYLVSMFLVRRWDESIAGPSGDGGEVIPHSTGKWPIIT